MIGTYIAAAGFILTLILAIVGGVWGVGNIKTFFTEKLAEQAAQFADQIGAEREALHSRISQLRSEILAEQKSQERMFGESLAAVRTYAGSIEKEMHEIEIWGRDNYALKSDVTKATDLIRDDIKAMGQDIKSDMRRLESKIDQRAN